MVAHEHYPAGDLEGLPHGQGRSHDGGPAPQEPEQLQSWPKG